MIPTLEITLKELESKEYSALSRLNGPRFRIEDKISQYSRKSDASSIFESLKQFLAVSLITSEKLEKELNGLSIPFSLAIASTIASAALNYQTEEKITYYDNKKIDLSKSMPLPLNDVLEVYIRAMQDTRPRSALEGITDSLYNWLHNAAVEELKKDADFKQATSFLAKISGKDYSIDLSQKVFSGKRKAQINVTKYVVAQTAEEKAGHTKNYIYGHNEVKNEFQQIAGIIKNLDIFIKRFDPKQLFNNYLLVGPPGTGKTTLVNSLASHCGMRFINVPCVELGSKFFSETASNIHAVYDSARTMIEKKEAKGVIIFFDEFDHIAKKRGYGNSPENDSLITTLNENLDGSSSRAGIITFGATNVEHIIDPAIASRFRKLYVGYPQSDAEIIGIHNIIIQKIEDYAHQKIFGNINYDKIMGFPRGDERYKSGRAIDKILHRAAIEKTEEYVGKKNNFSQIEIPLVSSEDIIKAYAEYKLEESGKSGFYLNGEAATAK